MSAAFFIILDRDDPGFETMVNGKFLAQDAKRLQKVAQVLGIRSLEEYVSYSRADTQAMMEELGATPTDIESAETSEQAWYNPQEGLDWIEKVIAHLGAEPSSVKNAEGVMADLQEYRCVLEQAQKIGARWALQLDF